MRSILAELSKEVQKLKAELEEYVRLIQRHKTRQELTYTVETEPQPFSVWDTAIRMQQSKSDIRRHRIYSLSRDSIKSLISRAVDLLIKSYGENSHVI